MLIRTAKDVGNLIRSARKSLGWSQGELAQQVGTTQKWVSFVENGRLGAQLDLVLRTLAALQVSLDGRLPTESPSSKASLIDQVANRGKYGTR